MALTVARAARRTWGNTCSLERKARISVSTVNQKMANKGKYEDVLDQVHDQVEEGSYQLEARLLVLGQVHLEHVAGGDKAVELEDENGIDDHAKKVQSCGPKQFKRIVDGQPHWETGNQDQRA